MTPRLTTGRRLRAEVDEMLNRVREELKESGLSWDEREQDAIARAALTADRAESLRTLYGTEADGENRPAVLVKVSAEIRACDKQVVDLLARLNPGVGVAKSERHQRAANYRVDRDRRLRSV